MFQEPFTCIPNRIIRGGHGATNLALLAVILSHGECYASAKTLAKELRCNRHTVFNAIKYWENLGVITVTRQNRKTSTIRASAEMSTSLGLKRALPLVPKRAHQGDPLKKNKEEELHSTFKEKKHPYIEGDQAWQDPADASHWRVKTYAGDWVEYVGNVSANLEWK